MKYPQFCAVVLVGLAAVASSGCALLTKGKTQDVIVRSTPSGAVTKINGTTVGVTPFMVSLRRDDVFRVDFEKNGFAAESAIVLPTQDAYNQRYLRWGLDYDLGYATDLVPAELAVEMTPSLGDVTAADKFAEMTAQIVRADALLASGELNAADHKYLVEKIIATYHNVY